MVQGAKACELFYCSTGTGWRGGCVDGGWWVVVVVVEGEPHKWLQGEEVRNIIRKCADKSEASRVHGGGGRPQACLL